MKYRTIISLLYSFILALTILSVPVYAVDDSGDGEGQTASIAADGGNKDGSQTENQNRNQAEQYIAITAGTAEQLYFNDGRIKSVSSLDESIAIANTYQAYDYETLESFYDTEYGMYLYEMIWIYGYGTGSTDVIVTDCDNNETIVHVTVKAAPLKLDATSMLIDGGYYDAGLIRGFYLNKGYFDNDAQFGYYYSYNMYYDYQYYNDDPSIDDYEEDNYVWEEVSPETESIKSAKSSNTKIVRLDSYDDGYEIIPVSAGSATITCVSCFGAKATFKVTVTKKYMSSLLKAKSSLPNIKYGSTRITGNAPYGTTISAKIGKKTYQTTANSKNKYTINIPVVKIGTKVYYKASYHGGTASVTRSVVKPGAAVSFGKVYRNTKKVKVTVWNVHAGDVIKIKVVGKTYKKKVKKGAAKATYSIKIKKPKKAGKKIKVTVVNKFKQSLTSKSDKVYYAAKLKRGMKQSRVRLVPGYTRKPDVRCGGWYEESWIYYLDGDYAICLLFKRGKLISWTFGYF